MNINRNNYEEFFLMYVDNELTAAERSDVEQFIQMNPDLKPELEVLQQTVLQPEPFSFDKSSLFAIASNGINKENHEEYFIEYVNNELSVSDKAATEKFVLQHPELQDSFTAFKSTVLPKEIIEFKNKEVLYRKEETRVIRFSFTRMAVAAALLGAVVLSVPLFTTKTEDAGTPMAENKKQSITVPATKSLPSVTNVTKETSKESPVNNTAIENIVSDKTDNNLLASNDVTKQSAIRNTVTNTPEEDVYTQLPTVQGGIVTATTDRSEDENRLSSMLGKAELKVQQADNTTTVAYQELDTEQEDNNTVYVGALSINKDKLKGVFRKAGRIFSAKTKTENEDGKLQVANLEIETRKLK